MTNKSSLGLWEVRFILEGMPLPEDRISVEIFSFQRLSKGEFEDLRLPALAKVKVEGMIKNTKELGERKLRDFLGLYALRVGYAIRIVRDYGVSQLAIYETRKRPKKHLPGKIYGASISPAITVHVTPKREPEFFLEGIKQANQDFETINFSSKRYAYLRTAMDYLLYSSASSRKEEKLIDLVISLEVLFSGEFQELSYSIAHRVASLLGKSKKQRGQIFKNIREIYKERSQVVHTGYSKYRKAETLEHIMKAREYVKQSIKKFLLLTPKYSRKEIHEKLDTAIDKAVL